MGETPNKSAYIEETMLRLRSIGVAIPDSSGFKLITSLALPNLPSPNSGFRCRAGKQCNLILCSVISSLLFAHCRRALRALREGKWGRAAGRGLGGPQGQTAGNLEDLQEGFASSSLSGSHNTVFTVSRLSPVTHPT